MSRNRTEEANLQDSRSEFLPPKAGSGDSSQRNDEPILTRNIPNGQPRPSQQNIQGGMPQQGMTHPGMQPMQPGMMQPGMQPGMSGQPVMMQPGMQPGMQVGMIRPGMQPQPGQFVQAGQPMPGQPMMNPNMTGGPNGMIMTGPGAPGGPGGYPGGPGGYPGGNNQFGRPMVNQQFPTVQNRFHGDNKGLQNVQDTGPSNYESSQVCLGKCSGCMGAYLPCLGCCTNPYQTVPEGFSGIVMRFGKFYKLVGPGMHYLLPDLDTLELVDKREKVVELKHQTVVSKDNTSFMLDAVLYYRINNSYKSRFAVSSLKISLMDLAVTTLRNAVGKMTMQQFLEQKEHLAEHIEADISHIAETWGVKVLRVLVQDVYLPQEFRNTFSSGAVAKRISEAQVIASKAEVEVAKLLKDAAAALSTDAAFQIRYITALEAISKSSNPKMIFFPADFTDVGTANGDLLNTMAEEMDTLLKKK